MIATDSPRILIVEDEALVAQGIERCLTSRGYAVSGIADTADAAVEGATAGVDLVLMDILLKGPRDGVWAATRIRGLRDVPIIFLTAFGDAATVGRARASGPYAYVVKPIRDEDLLRSIDIAVSLHRTQKSLCRSEIQQALEGLAAGLAHEARNPLFGLTSTVEAMVATGNARTDAARYFSAIQEQAKRLNNLVTRLTDLGRPSSPPRPFLLRDAASQARHACSEDASFRGVHVSIEGRADARAFGDPQRVSEFLRELLGNAVHASPLEGAVKVILAAPELEAGRWVECRIEDRGAGFTVAQIARGPIPFSSDTPGRLGLGLAIAARAVRDQGGSMTLDNRPDGGARVMVRLPAPTPDLN